MPTATPPPPDDLESRYSDAAERLLQVMVDAYNNLYAKSVAGGYTLPESEVVEGFLQSIAGFYPTPEAQVAALGAMLVKAIQRLPRPGSTATPPQSQVPWQ